MCPFEPLQESDLVSFEVLVDGSVADFSNRIEEIVIKHEINHLAWAEIIINDGDPALETFEAAESAALVPGNQIEIKLGYSNNNSKVFLGIITGLEAQASQHFESRLIIYCKDKACLLSQVKKTQCYSDIKDDDLISQLCQAQGIESNLANTQELDVHEQLVQMRQSDWDFILDRSFQNGLMVSNYFNQINVIPIAEQNAAGTISYGRNVISANLKIDARRQYNETIAYSWDASSQSLTEVKKSSNLQGLGNLDVQALARAHDSQNLELRQTSQLSESQLRSIAAASANIQGLQTVIGNIVTQGQATLQIGEWLEVEGFGQRFNGKSIVGGVTHKIANGNWTSNIHIGLDNRWMQWQTEQYKNCPPVQIGKVLSLEDPEQSHRVGVELVLANESGTTIWARLCNKDAGEDRGSVFIPEIGDEVILSFNDGDRNQPVVLGSLYSKGRNPAEEFVDDNNLHGWVGKTGIKWMVDEDKKQIELLTPAGNKIVLSDEEAEILLSDENGNKLTLNIDGISLTSTGNINLKADRDVTIEGQNCSLTGSLNADVKGGSGASLKADATTVVQGSLVQIN